MYITHASHYNIYEHCTNTFMRLTPQPSYSVLHAQPLIKLRVLQGSPLIVTTGDN